MLDFMLGEILNLAFLKNVHYAIFTFYLTANNFEGAAFIYNAVIYPLIEGVTSRFSTGRFNNIINGAKQIMTTPRIVVPDNINK